jgi:hypothetical protein
MQVYARETITETEIAGFALAEPEIAQHPPDRLKRGTAVTRSFRQIVPILPSIANGILVNRARGRREHRGVGVSP